MAQATAPILDSTEVTLWHALEGLLSEVLRTQLEYCRTAGFCPKPDIGSAALIGVAPQDSRTAGILTSAALQGSVKSWKCALVHSTSEPPPRWAGAQRSVMSRLQATPPGPPKAEASIRRLCTQRETGKRARSELA
jgi:hypothetical protein